jgi:SM-20-related protein
MAMLPSIRLTRARGSPKIVTKRTPKHSQIKIAMIDLESLSASSMCEKPFPWFLTKALFDADVARELCHSFPTTGLECTMARGSNFWARNLVTRGQTDPSARSLSEVWHQLANLLTSTEYREAIESLTKRRLSGLSVYATLCKYSPASHNMPHTDRDIRVISQLIYFNELWLPDWGGDLLLLNSDDPEDIANRVHPELNSSVIFVRSANSWHAVDPITIGVEAERRSLLLHFSL